MKSLPEELKRVFVLLEQGMDRKSIAQEEGIKVASLDQRFRRHGYNWNPILKQYTESDSIGSQYIMDGKVVPPRVVQVVNQFRSVKADARQIARRLSYRSELEMAQDMLAHGFSWSTEERNYVPSARCVPVESKEGPQGDEHFRASENDNFDNARNQSMDEGSETGSTPRIPRYRILSPRLPRTVSIALSLHQLLQQYAREYNIRQSEVVETALVDFLRQYGYRRQINTVLDDN